jgi:hypothetical protein
MQLPVFMLVVLTITATIWPATAEAQRNCSKGKPCGNSCISRDKVCRIESPANTPAPAPETVRSSTVEPSQNLLSPAQTEDLPPAATASEYPWVASFADGIYFKATCPAAQDLAPSNRRYIRSIQDAESAGFRRSRTPSC